jgi:hypothetical protein
MTVDLCGARLKGMLGGCDRKATVHRDGKSYCWQHDPERLRRKYEQEWAERKAELEQMEKEADARVEQRRPDQQGGFVMAREPRPEGAVGLRLELSPADRDRLRIAAAKAGFGSMASYARWAVLKAIEESEVENIKAKKSGK